MTVSQDILNLVRSYCNNAGAFERYENNLKEIKNNYKSLFLRFINSHTTEVGEGLIHSLKSIKQVEPDSTDIGIAVAMASKWLHKHDMHKSDHPRKTPRKNSSENDETKAQADKIVAIGSVFENTYEALYKNTDFLAVIDLRSKLIEYFKTAPSDKRSDILSEIQQKLRLENQNEQFSIAFAMVRIIALFDKATKA